MIDLNDIAIFAKVAQLQSFSRAAQALAMPVSTISRRVSTLEEQLGVTLLQRTTRRLSLTAQGRAYLDQCNEPLNSLYDAQKVLTRTQKQPEGLLKVSAPVIFGQAPFYDLVSSFMRTYPQIEIDLSVTNTFVDLIADNVDLAIRFGELQDSSLVAQRLGKSVRYLVCTPDYLARREAPSDPDDLRGHRCILLNGRNNEAEWELVSNSKTTKIRVSGNLTAHDFHTVSAFTYRGHGIGLLPSTYCEAQIASGDLIRLLPGWSSPEILIHAVYPSRRFLPTKLQVFLEALKAWKSPLWIGRR